MFLGCAVTSDRRKSSCIDWQLGVRSLPNLLRHSAVLALRGIQDLSFRNAPTLGFVIPTPSARGGGGTCFPVQHYSVSQRASLRLTRTLVLTLCLLTSASLCARSKNLNAALDTDYVLALSAANHFLHAWQTNDQETGILMLTNRLKQKTSEDALSSFFSSASNRPQSFEIERGRRLAAGRYKFPVTLFHNPATANRRTSPRTSGLIVVHAGKDDWAIDRLP